MTGKVGKIAAGIFICFFGSSLVLAAELDGVGPDYPHSEVTNTSCLSCHYNIANNNPPAWFDSENPYDNLCESCHNDAVLPHFSVRTHSSNNTSSQYGEWSIDCRTCHWPHWQRQYRTYGSDSFVFSGNSSQVNDTSLVLSGAGWEEDQFNDYILVPNTDHVAYNLRIIDTSSDTLVVDGEIDPAKATDGDHFAIFYGKLIRDVVSTPNSGDRTVRFFDTNGTNSYADGDSTYDGICEVCHTQTDHFRNDGNATDQHHDNVGGQAGNNCMPCHDHQYGFAHGAGSGGTGCDECHGTDAAGHGTVQSHSTHTESDADDVHGPGGVPCSTCHDTSSFPYFKSGTDSNGDGLYNLDETDVCDNCHSPGGLVDGVNDSDVGVKNNWPGSIYDGQYLQAGKEMWCISCHDQDPANSKQDGSGVGAPNKAGDGSTWGYFVTGHGVSGPYNATLHGEDGPGYSCLVCHDKSVTHFSHISGDATRLRSVGDDGLDYTSDISEVCLDCHEPDKSTNGALGYDASAEATVHSGGVLGDYDTMGEAPDAFPAYGDEADYSTNPGYQCDDCHEVHGTQKLAMILDTIDGKVGGVSNPVSINGFAANSTDLSGLDPSNAADNGVCDACHAAGDDPHPDTNHAGNHNYGNTCVTCHPHSNTFAHGAGAKSGGSTVCVECHGHDAGSEYDEDMSYPYTATEGTSSMGAGSSWSHSTHTETDSDDLVGPAIYCDTCHDTSNMPRFKNQDGSGLHTLAETDICDNCHSPGGTYDGVNDPEIGAKANWDNGIYDAGRVLKSGKEKWCAACHDESASNSKVDGSGITAPNIVGDEDGSFNYGTGWGFYKTGHGVPSSETIPASGGAKDGPDKGCGDCHDLSKPHIDGDSRTFDCDSSTGGACSNDYQSGYRLKDIDGQIPMEMPYTGRNTESFRLCFSCHTNTDDWLSDDLNYRDKTNFYDTGRADEKNLHIYHLRWSQGSEIDWDEGTEANMSCITCHNVHGSRNVAMIRSGELTGLASMSVRYGNACSTHTAGQEEPSPNNITLEVSNKSTMLGALASPYCSHCHGTGTGIVTVARTPADLVDIAPELNWVGGPAYASDGVNPDAGASGTTFTFKVEYLDVNQDGPPDTIQLWIDRNNNGSYEDNADPALDEKIDMVSVFEEPDTCAPYSKGVDYVTTATVDKVLAGGNSISYRFYADYGGVEATGEATHDSALTILNDAPTLSWTGESNYESDGVDPDYGAKDGNYTFRVRYTDDDGDSCPASDSSEIQVWIDLDQSSSYDVGEKYNLTEVSGADTNCTTAGGGKLYYTDQVLPNVSGSDITYDYRFYATDGTDNATGAPADSGGNVTVAGSTNNPPLLAWDTGTCRPEGAMPPRSALSSTINFSVRYFDEDNECPAGGSSDIQVYVDLDGSGSYSVDEQINMSEADGDVDCTTAGGGKLYTVDVVPTTADEGLAYEFHATDGTDEALGEPRTAGGTVDVIAADYVVRQDGSEDWTTISDAISNSSSGAVILVYDGTYNEYVSKGSGVYYNMNLYSACGPEETIISDSNDPVVYFYRGGSSTFDGFTVTGGSDTGILAAGDDFDLSDSQPTVSNCIIRDNGGRGVEGYRARITLSDSEVYGNQGGGVLSYSANITDSTIRDNAVTGNGGGIASTSESGSFDLNNVTISGNNATGSGGGIYCNVSSSYTPSWEKVSLSGNRADGSGGGAYTTYCSPTFTNSLISDNNATNGGGLGVGVWSYVWLENNTIVNNTATTGDGGAYYSTDGPVNMANSIAWGNRAADEGHIGYCSGSSKSIYLYDSIIENNGDADITDDNYFVAINNSNVIDSGTNYDTDPNFKDTGSGGDYHVNDPSDAIDRADDNSGRGIPSDDLDGNSRPAGSEDIGAYEYQGDGVNEAPTLAWTGEAGYSEDGVVPDSGEDGSDYIFRVSYSDPEDVPPVLIELWLDVNDDGVFGSGEKFTMGSVGGGIYQYTYNNLAYTGDGLLAYRFYATDGVKGATGDPTTQSTVEVTQATVSFTTSSQTTVDENGTATITAELSQVSAQDVSVPFTINGGSTATGSGTDYSITSSPVTITAGNTTAEITVTIATDSLDEDNETVIVDMGTPTNAGQGAVTSHTVTITDDDPVPTVAFTSASQVTADESGNATITAELSAVSGRNVSVPFTVNATSTAEGDGTDYNITSSPVTIAAGNSTAAITVTIAEDGFDESDETVIVDMGTPINAGQGGITSHTVTITDDDAASAPPNTPTNSSPDGATGVSRTPTLTASAFSDPDGGDTHAASQWQISTASDFTTITYDSGVVTDLTSHTVSVTLDPAMTYYWRVRYQDSRGAWSSYSTGTSFTTVSVDSPAGAVAYWHFDEGAGTNAVDSVGGSNGTLKNSTTWATGVSGDAASFTGAGDKVEPAAGVGTGLLDSHTVHTIEGWIKWDGSTDRDIIFMEGGTSEGYGLTIKSGSDEITYTIRSSGAIDNVVAAESYIPIGEWTHVAATYDGAAGEMRLYVNGNEVAAQTSGVPASIGDPSLGWRIGGSSEADVHDGSTSTITSFAGEIDELVIYNQALTQEQIQARMDALGSAPAQPVNSSPTDGELSVSVTPTLTCDAFQDDDNDTHAASRWQIRKAGGWYGDADSYDSSWTSTDLTSLTLDDNATWPAGVSSWSYRRPLTLNQATNSTNQRVKISLSADGFKYDDAEATGYDLRFYQGDGTALSYSRPIWDTNGTSVLFVEVQDSGVDKIYMYYGKSGAADGSNATVTPKTLVDSGFEDFSDLASGYWEKKQTNSSSPTFFADIETTGGNPDSYVYFDNDPIGYYGMTYIAQQFTVPDGTNGDSSISNASFSIDYQTYCGRGDRSGMFEVLLLEKSVWDNVIDGSAFDYRDLYDGSGDEALWHEFIKTNAGDVTSWTSGASSTDLASVLNDHHGENLVAVMVWTAWHDGNVEWARMDNFELNYDSSVDPYLELTATVGSQQAYPGFVLDYDTQYFWRVQHKDDTGSWSLWSDETSFTTTTEFTGTVYTVCKDTHEDFPCDFQSINGGIDDGSVLDGDKLLVSADTYSENIDFDGKRITIESVEGEANTTIQGDGSNAPVVAFGGNETSVAVLDGFTLDNQAASSATRGVYIYGASPTVKNCIINGNAANNSSVDAVNVGGAGIFVKNGAPMVDNCTITANVNANRNGGGVYVTGANDGTRIMSSTIAANSADHGGGMYADVGLTISHTDISDNTVASFGRGGALYLNGTDQTTTFSGGSITLSTAQYGGGVYITGGADLTVDDGAEISGNTASDGGGAGVGAGVYINGSGSTLVCSKAFFKGNDADQYGGALYNNGGSLTLTNSNITGNTADGQSYSRGGGIYTTGTATVDIYSSTIAGNYALYGGGGLYHNGGNSTAHNSIFWDNDAGTTDPEIYGAVDVNYCDVEGGAAGTGNIDSDPLFITPAAAINGSPTTAGDFHIQGTSGVIDQGNATGAPADDIDGDVRPQGAGYDMGADEYLPSDQTVVGDAGAAAAGDTSIDISMPYTEDGNQNNTYTVEYKLSSSGTWLDWGTNPKDHTTSPYTDTIAGLTAGETYDVRMTYNDTDGVNGTNPQTEQVILSGGAAADYTVCASGCDYALIQDAIDAASDGEIIEVDDGSYSENIDFVGKDITVRSANGVAFTTIQGDGSNAPVVNFGNSETDYAVLDGFTINNQNDAGANHGNGGIRITNGAIPTIKNSVIKGNDLSAWTANGAGIYISGGGINADNCTIGVSGTPNIGQYGAGIYAINSGLDVTIADSNINYNQASKSGAAIYLSNMTGNNTISGTTLSNNSVTNDNGAGIYSFGSPLTITNSTIDNNTANTYGGGLYVDGDASDVNINITGGSVNGNDAGNGAGFYVFNGAHLNLTKLNIKGNRATQHGAGVKLLSGSNATITNCMIAGNAAGTSNWEDGGGIFSAGTLEVYSSTIAGNYAGQGGGVYIGGGTATITNSILYANTAGNGSTHQIEGSPTVTYSDVDQAGYAGSDGNINEDPSFVLIDPAGAGSATTGGDYHIQSGSLVVDQGTATNAPADDIDGDSRPLGSGIDMGADEKE